jgi:REP element-mobilizing transposase RayT
MPEPLAYFLTWPTYGTWLPGDERGWVKYRRGKQKPDPIRKREAAARMTEDACQLDEQQRELVQTTVGEHCKTRGWHLFAVNCRSNHVHVVVAAKTHRKTVRNELKAWCTRRLKELERKRNGHDDTGSQPGPNPDKSDEPSKGEIVLREKWWAERGSAICIDHAEFLEDVIHYVLEAQDLPLEL